MTATSSKREPLKLPTWSHMHDLKKLKGQRIMICLVGDNIWNVMNWREVELVDSDAFTLKVRLSWGPNRKSAVTVLFKHVVSGMYPVGEQHE